MLHLPRLPLDIFPGLPSPSAIVGRERIVVADDAATAAGVRPGLRLAAAWAVLPNLTVRARDDQREQAVLHRLACWAGTFTSDVCCLPPQTLLLEVAGSLRLFGGAATLFERVVAGCVEQGFEPRAALAPTPLAAQWLAAAGDTEPCLHPDELPARLDALPLAVLPITASRLARLHGFGACSLADVLRLPRAGLARRLGADLVADLARARGELPDPRPRFVFPERFAERLELPACVEKVSALGFAGRRLLAALCGWLTARVAGIRTCVFEFEHEPRSDRSPVSFLSLGFAGATRDIERLTHALLERLPRFELPAAVVAIVLRAEVSEALSGRSASLFGARGTAAGADSLTLLAERLQSRLGPDAVHGLATVAEHRPETASRRVAPGASSGALAVEPARGVRPLWLLAQPRVLREEAGRPHRGGPLRLLTGPERIESGWWDADEPGTVGDVRRDYFIALSVRAEWLWIFRSREGWFLHGMFA